MANYLFLAALALASICTTSATVYFEEKFDASWADRWTHSSWKKSEGTAGEFSLSAGKFFGNEEADKGIQTGPDSKFFSIYAELPEVFDNTGKDLVLQYSVKHEQDIDCGGGYIKMIPASSASDMAAFGGETPYSIMFGPDVCGYTKKVHVILTYKGENYLIKKDIKAESDRLTHVYTLVLKPDNTYKDPKAVKPKEWDERPKIDDPEVVKPDGYDDVPATIADPDATMPEDWDEEEDGTWEAPTIPNPEFKGAWKQPQIENPEYKGIWVADDIPNPDFVEDKTLYQFKDTKFLGFELWQVKAGTIFDNIFVGDSFEEAEKFATATWGASKDAEKEAFDKMKAEEDAARAAAAPGPGDEDDEMDGGDDEDDEYDEMDMGGHEKDEL
eukprot:gene2046-18223_t